ncbi:hypothetical protein [Natroniella sulfidigena]|nr:hypothetical protein [Natroniella sulfidigena]
MGLYDFEGFELIILLLLVLLLMDDGLFGTYSANDFDAEGF